ncbi:FecR domain-containing protein [Ruegeria aquimaris]|nr:FecR domain-containing protein [Ruegeria sp. XHP0148]
MRRTIIGIVLMMPTAVVAATQTDALDAPMEIVTFGPDDTIRGVVEKYLRDPDLWPTILALNGIASPADLRPGVKLQLPVRQVFAADEALLGSLQAIQKANSEGARIFAPVEIGEAIRNRDEAVQQREVGEWRQVVSFADVATVIALEALDISIAQRDRSAEAVVSDVQGDVEGRAPIEPSWSDRELNDVLVEFERVRTLSSSTTQITFRDLSRLRLNPNSNATIQRMRSDPLTGGEVTKVSLAEGDFYALLNQLSEKTTFEIEVPGIETKTNSADFWIKKDQSGARFVNYDQPGLEIEENGRKIDVGQGEGVVITGAGAQRATVLNSPRLSAPDLGAILYTRTADLDWDSYDGAEAYWLEVAADPGFNQMQVSEWGIRDTAFQVELAPARYHWRVAALDRLGLPGAWSTPRDFTVRLDDTPPFLTLLSPAPDAMVTEPSIEVLGATELDAALILNGKPLQQAADGSFVLEVSLVPGRNTLSVFATDPAGNTSTRSQTVIYRPSASVEITLADDIPRVGAALATRSDQLSVNARTTAEPGAPVVVRGSDGPEVLRTGVEPGGRISFTVPVGAEETAYRIEVLAPDGSVEGATEFVALRDQMPPELALDLPPPRATADTLMGLAGDAGDALSLTLNGTAVPLAEGRFDLSVTLTPGANTFDLVATDAVGNVTVRRLETLLDIEPPVILEVAVTRPQGDGGPITIEARAEDASGLRQAAPFVLRVDADEIEGFLRCDAATGVCRVSLPPQPGDLDLIELMIEDYAGNAAFQ